MPDQAKSAATILALGAHHIMMGPTSDLGPVDPQFRVGPTGALYAGRDIIAAVESAQLAITASPESYPLHAALLSDVTALLVQSARMAIARTPDLVMDALRSNPDRAKADAEQILAALKEPLIDTPRDHSAVLGADDAANLGLPILKLDPRCEQWQRVWRLYAKYFLISHAMYEGRTSSRGIPA